MIALLEGSVAHKEEGRLILQVGAVGVWVFVPRQLAEQAKIGQALALYTHLVVREDSLSLYGFATAEERDLFVLLLGVNGVGPRLALSVISTLSPSALRRAVFQEQPEIIGRVPGVGKRTAQKILLHLQGRIAPQEDLAAVADLAEVDTEVLDALVALGYSVVEAQSAIQSIPKDAPQDVEERLRLALQHFSK